MMSGLTSSTFYLTILAACLCVWLQAAVTTARPGDSSEASEWATEWQQVADLWKPRDDKDQWRAFEPVKEASTTRWWEGTLDDDLWSQKSEDPSTRKYEDVSSTASPSAASTKPVPQSDRADSNASQTATPMVSSSTVIADSDSGQPAFKKGEVNTFVEPDFGNYYRSSGESYGGKVWDSAYSDYSQRKEHAVQEDTKNHNRVQEGKESSVKLADTNGSGKPTISVATYSHEPAAPDVQQDEPDSDIHETKYKYHTLQDSQLREEDDTSVFKEPVKHASSTNVAENASHSGATTVELGKLSEHLATVEDLSLSSSVVNTSHNLVLTNTDKSDPISGMGVRIIPAEQKEKPVIKVLEQKDAISRDTNAIYGKGERLPMPHAGAVHSAVAQNMPTTRKQEEVTTKKANSQFKDWEDWDNSAFDYYDNKDDQDKDAKKETKDNGISKGQEVKIKSSDIKVVNDDTEDDIDDYYDSEEIDDEEDEYEDEDDLDEDEDEYDNTDEINKDTTVLPVNIKKSPLKKSAKSMKVHKLSSLEVEKHADNPGSNKETASSSVQPNHKPSVKKDLNNPANSKKEDNASGHRKPEDASIALSSVPNHTADKNEMNWPHSHPIQLNTESGALTSPNPPPHGPDDSRPSTRTATPSTEPTRTSEEISAALENMSQQKSEVNTGFILSFPLEFCKVDSECRAGRTCVIGVCRCFTPSMCAGHHKPVCGSDGFQYASHCELHRVACVNRIHIRVDRRSKCFQDEIEQKEKIWLMEQQRLMQEKSARQKLLTEKKIQISPSNTYPAQDNSEDQAPSNLKIVHLPAEEKISTVTEKATTPAAVTNDKKECTWKEMGAFKEALLMFYCQKFAEPNCKLEVKTDREYLSMLVFSYCDRDYDYYLTVKELDDKERDEHFTKNIIQNCHLHDFIKYADNLETDGKLTVSEFTSAFEMPVPTPAPHVQIEVIPTLASAGNGLELKCGIDAATIIWKRHGTQLSDDKRSHQLMVFDDGALFFSTVGLHHIGNYTCMDANDESKAQIHRLRVQSLPIVEVMPVVQTHMTGSDIELKCHAEGVPKPTITWKLAGKVLQNSPHTTHYYGGGHIVVHNAKFDMDAGTYTCSAHSQAGTSEKSVAVHVLPPSVTTSKESPKEAGTFVVFHPKGISAYDPLRCLLRHQIAGDFSNFKFIPEALEGPLTLCQKDKDCQWGEAVRVGSEFIYVCQPDQNRVMVMNAGDSWNPLQIIDTDKRPEKLWYVKHLDQVWVLCSNQEHGDSGKTIMVIRDASQHIQHRSVHTQPVGNHFDMVQDLFLAPANDLEHEFSFGYVSHHGQNGLFKLSLEDMSYTKAIDLTNYGCVPTNIAFVPIGGHVVIQCVSAADQHTLQLVMDYLTDTITSTTSLNGHPMTSPDSRHLVSVDKLTGKVIVTSVSDEGALETTYEVTVSASISDVAFMPAMSHQGYDLVLTSADDDDVIIMNLVTGKVEKIPGSQYLDPTNSWHPSPINRHIISGNSMSNYLMVPSRSSLAILDAKFKQVECEFLDSVNSKVMLYIPSSYTSS